MSNPVTSPLAVALAESIYFAVENHDANRAGEENREYYFTSSTHADRARRAVCLAEVASTPTRTIGDVVGAARSLSLEEFAAWLLDVEVEP